MAHDLLKRATVWRDYPALLERHGLSPDRPTAGGSREQRMRRAIDLFWGAFSSTDISWIGFYEKAAADEMLLVVREPKPACSPIGLHGMCGRCWRDRRPIVVADVRTLGENYVACDPMDQSEVVVPCIDEGGECWGVLDADSHDLGAFDEHDARGMTKVLISLGLTTTSVLTAPVLRP